MSWWGAFGAPHLIIFSSTLVGLQSPHCTRVIKKYLYSPPKNPTPGFIKGSEWLAKYKTEPNFPTSATIVLYCMRNPRKIAYNKYFHCTNDVHSPGYCGSQIEENPDGPTEFRSQIPGYHVVGSSARNHPICGDRTQRYSGQKCLKEISLFPSMNKMHSIPFKCKQENLPKQSRCRIWISNFSGIQRHKCQ